MTARTHIIAPLLLVLAASLVYFPVLGFEFLSWDDRILVYENPIVLEFSLQSIKRAFTTFDPELYIPLTLVTYMAEHAFFRLNPLVFHLMNVALHAVNAVMVFWLVLKLLGKQRIAIVAALLFAIHPLNTEAVAWISARKDLLATFFALSTMLMYLRWQDRQRLSLYIASLVLFLCALLSKVSAAPVPLILMLFQVLPRRNSQDRPRPTALVPFASLSIAFIAVALIGKETNVAALMPLQAVLLWCRGVVFALQQFLLPFDLSLLYPYTREVTAASPGLGISTVAVAIVISATALLWRRLPSVCFGLAFFLVALLPMVAVHVRGGEVYLFADRHLYLPMVGMVIAFAALVALLLQTTLNYVKYIAAAFVVVIVVALGVLAHHRALAWHDNEKLYLDALEAHPELTFIRFNLGLLYDNEHRYDEAIAVYEAILKEDPDYVKALNAYGYLLLRQGEFERSIAMLERAVSVDPLHYRAWINLGRAYGAQGLYREGIAAFKRAMEIDPRTAGAAREEVERLLEGRGWIEN